MDATGFWDHLPVVFTVPKLVFCVDYAWEEGSKGMAWVSENFQTIIHCVSKNCTLFCNSLVECQLISTIFDIVRRQ